MVRQGGTRLGVRWQGGSRDTAFAQAKIKLKPKPFRARESGVALRFPPQSMTVRVGQRSFTRFLAGLV
jgi:hypothetical protein